MRATRLVFVEDDPALLGVLTRLWARRTVIEILVATSSASEALSFKQLAEADVALSALELGPEKMSGVDTRRALRRLNPSFGIVIHFQRRLDHVTQRVPTVELCLEDGVDALVHCPEGTRHGHQ